MQIQAISLATSVDAHGRNQISAMIVNAENNKEIISIAQDGRIKKWNMDTLQLLKSQRIRRGYLTSLINFDSGYLVGTGNGEIIKFTQNLSQQWAKKIHIDGITDILQCQKYLITIGFDGKVNFLDKCQLKIFKQIDLTVPLTKLILIDGSIFVSGNPSFEINLNNFQVKQLKRSHTIINFKSRIIGCSDENGLSIVGSQVSDENFPCHYMLNFKDKLICVTQKTLGVFNVERNQLGDDHFSYKLFKAQSLHQGYSVKAGIVDHQYMFLAGQDGVIYKFKIQLQDDKNFK